MTLTHITTLPGALVARISNDSDAEGTREVISRIKRAINSNRADAEVEKQKVGDAKATYRAARGKSAEKSGATQSVSYTFIRETGPASRLDALIESHEAQVRKFGTLDYFGLPTDVATWIDNIVAKVNAEREEAAKEAAEKAAKEAATKAA